MDNSNQILIAISHKIKYERSDNFLNHCKTYFQLDPVNYSGTCSEKGFILWRFSWWTGLFYIVIYGHFILENDKTKVILKSKLNIVGLCAASILFCLFFLSITNFQIFSLNFSEILLGLFFGIIMTSGIWLGSLNERKECINDITEIIKNANLKSH